MDAFKLIPITLSILVYNCSVDYMNKINSGVDYKPLNETLDICEIIKNSNGIDEEIRNNIHRYLNDCTIVLDNKLCEVVTGGLKDGLGDLLIDTIAEYPAEQREEIRKNKNCILGKFEEHKIFKSFINFFTKPENALMNIKNASQYNKQMQHPINLANKLCSDYKNDQNINSFKLLITDPCTFQFYIDDGNDTGNLQKPLDCESIIIDVFYIQDPQHLIKIYPFSDFLLKTSDSLLNCFVNKIKDNRYLFVDGIETWLAWDSLNIRDKLLQILKSMNQLAIGCYGEL